MYYEVLGVDRGASTAEIRRAYRAAVKRAHPDRGGSVSEFMAVQTAWEVLSDPERRALFDRTSAPPTPPPPRPGRAPGPTTSTKAHQTPPRPRPQQARPTPPPPRPQPRPQPTGAPTGNRDRRQEPPPSAATGSQRHPGRFHRLRQRLRKASQPTPLLLTALGIVAAGTGGVTVWAFGRDSRLMLVISSLYLLATAVCVAARGTRFPAFEQLGSRLILGAWLAAGVFAIIGLGSWIAHQTQPGTLIWAGILGAFAAASTALWATLPHTRRT